MTASTIGALVAFFTVAVLIARYGPRRLAVLAAPGALLVAPVMAAQTRPEMLAVALLLYGFAGASLQAPMNSQAVAVERSYGRPLMGTFHACFSLGVLLGGLAGELCARVGLSPTAQLTGSAVVLAAGLALAVRWLPRDDASAPKAAGRRRMTRNVAVLAVIAFCGVLAEGTANAWSAIYVKETLGAGAVTGALAYASFAGAMTLARMTGDRFVARLGRQRFLRLSAAVAATGMAGALAVGTVPAAVLGFAVVGIGSPAWSRPCTARPETRRA